MGKVRYKTLERVFHANPAPSAAQTEEKARRESPSALKWHYKIGKYEMFCVVTPEMMALTEQIYAEAAATRRIFERLHPAVVRACLRAQIVEELQKTNEIEGVRSTRAELRETLRSVAHETGGKERRFHQLVRLYLELIPPELTTSAPTDNLVAPTGLEQIREIYERALAGELTEENHVDGELFRRGAVEVGDLANPQKVHRGAIGEEAIKAGLEEMMRQSNDEKIPQLVRIAAAHFIFEHVHPFYDGNGRTGRYLMALSLTEGVSPYGWLGLTGAISRSKRAYYRAFEEVEKPLNCGEITYFVLVMLDFFRDAFATIRQLAEGVQQKIVRFDERVETKEDLDADQRQLLKFLGRAWIADAVEPCRLQELAQQESWPWQRMRRASGRLEEAGLLGVVKRKPLEYVLTERALDELGL